MVRTHLFFKVEVEHDEEESRKIGGNRPAVAKALWWCGRWVVQRGDRAE
jgi:hypothetical protein